MSWFVARLLFESVHVPASEEAMFEDRLLAVKAKDERAAIASALTQARKSEQAERYQSATGDSVRWELRALLDVKEMTADALEEGAELYYSFLTASEARSLEAMFPEKVTPQPI